MPTCEYIHFSFPISFSPILSPNLCLDLSSRLVTCHFYLTPRPRFKRSDRTQFPRSIFGLNTLTGLHWSAGQIYSVEFPLCLSLLRDTGSLLCSQLPSGGAAARCFFRQPHLRVEMEAEIEITLLVWGLGALIFRRGLSRTDIRVSLPFRGGSFLDHRCVILHISGNRRGSIFEIIIRDMKNKIPRQCANFDLS